MTATGPERVIWLDDLFPAKDAVVPSFGAYAGVDPLPGHEAEIEKAMLKPHAHMTCWKKAEIPARLHYGSNPRVPQIWCMADDGWLVITRAIAAAYGNKPLWGNHGHDIADPKMAALFVAEGPAFKDGETIPEFPNVDVYPMLTKLLDITAQPNDGDDTLLKAALH
jgi:predicted AlkP superfamily pyrophosphatase or phosphodiesterase